MLAIIKFSQKFNNYISILFSDKLKRHSQVFSDAKHVYNCEITKRENNNRIERLNGTLRERTKVSRGWKTSKTPIAEGQRIQYNFVKPHMALDGLTPAQKAGVKIEGRNRWRIMIENAKQME